MKRDQLSTYHPGEIAIVKGIVPSELAPKMVEMGLYIGKRIKVLFRAPFGGPMAVDVDGYVLSLRMDEARLISVEQEIR